MSVVGRSLADPRPLETAQPTLNVGSINPTTGVISPPIGTSTNPTSTQPTASSASTAAVGSSQSTVAEGSRIIKASAGNLYGINATSGASAGYLLVYDSATVPADGATTPKKTYVMAANSTIAFDFDMPIRCNSGIVLVFSTTGPFLKTISATAFLAADFA